MQKKEEIYIWGDSIPYNSYTERLKYKYGGRVQKISVNTNGTCPNKDGSKAIGGCTYCNNNSFVPSYTKKYNDIKNQIEEGIVFFKNRYKKAKIFVAYFQAYTNTYGDFKQIVKQYNEALSHPNINGLVVGTRPDCVDDYILDYFKEISKSYYFSLELGIESTYNDTLKFVNRGHSFEDSIEAIYRAKKKEIHVGGHIMLGLPYETKEMMLKQTDKINNLGLNTIKLHQLQIIKHTFMAQQYKSNSDMFNLFSSDEYIDFIINFMERLDPSISIERLVSESPPNVKIAPNWDNKLRAYDIQNMIIDKMKNENKYQGRLFYA